MFIHCPHSPLQDKQVYLTPVTPLPTIHINVLATQFHINLSLAILPLPYLGTLLVLSYMLPLAILPLLHILEYTNHLQHHHQ